MKNFLSFETNPRVLAQFLWHLYMDKDKSSQIKQEKKIKPWKFGLFRLFYWPQTIQNENLGFCMIKWSLVTNIHWKFEGLWASSFGATKVYYLPFWFKDGVCGEYCKALETFINHVLHSIEGKFWMELACMWGMLYGTGDICQHCFTQYRR